MHTVGDSSQPALILRIPAADGALVALKRRVSAGGTPVLFLHGLAVNADLWDLPDVRGRGFHYRSLAILLREAGCDIWLMNLRGHGAPHMFSRPAPGQRDWCLDHFILYDLPAAVAHVQHATGKRPFVIGASMGAISLVGYLQGCRWEARGASGRIVADGDLARRRQEALAGAVFVELPALLRWPESFYRPDGRLRWGKLLGAWRRRDPDSNAVFEVFSHTASLRRLLDLAGRVPVRWLSGYRPRTTPARPPGPVLRAIMQRLLETAGTFTGATHHRAEVMLTGRRYVFDDMKAGVLRQLARCVRAGALVSELGTPPHVYSDFYELLDLPALVVQGGRDRIAHPALTRTAFFNRISSRDKQFLLYPPIAHGEIEAAPYATEHIYPEIIRWIRARDESSPDG